MFILIQSRRPFQYDESTGMIGKGLICLDKGEVCTEKGNYLSGIDIIGCSLLLDGRNIGCLPTGPI